MQLFITLFQKYPFYVLWQIFSKGTPLITTKIQIYKSLSPSTSHVLDLALLLPLKGFFHFIAAVTFTETLMGIAFTAPLFVIFS